MSILDNNIPSNPVPPANIIAERIKRQTRLTYQNMVNAFNDGAKTFWTNSAASPSDIAAALGANAKEVFELHAKLGALLASIKPESIVDGSSVVGNFTMNDDGTVTIVVPTPTPEG